MPSNVLAARTSMVIKVKVSLKDQHPYEFGVHYQIEGYCFFKKELLVAEIQFEIFRASIWYIVSKLESTNV